MNRSRRFIGIMFALLIGGAALVAIFARRDEIPSDESSAPAPVGKTPISRPRVPPVEAVTASAARRILGGRKAEQEPRQAPRTELAGTGHSRPEHQRMGRPRLPPVEKGRVEMPEKPSEPPAGRPIRSVASGRSLDRSGIDDETFRRTVNDWAATRRCAKAAPPASHRGPDEAVRLRLTIGDDGRVKEVQALDVHGARQSAFASCLTDQVNQLQFPARPGAEEASREATFVF